MDWLYSSISIILYAIVYIYTCLYVIMFNLFNEPFLQNSLARSTVLANHEVGDAVPGGVPTLTPSYRDGVKALNMWISLGRNAEL